MTKSSPISCAAVSLGLFLVATSCSAARDDVSPKGYAPPAAKEGFYRADAARSGDYAGSFSRSSERIRWKANASSGFTTSPVVARGFVIAGHDGGLSAFDVSSGSQRWKFRTNGEVNCAPAVADQTVFFGSDDKTFYALDLNSGKVRWKYDVGAGVSDGGPVIVGSVVMFGADDGRIYALRSDTGSRVWTSTFKARFRAPIATDGKAVFAGDETGLLRALDAEDGRTRWEYSTRAKIYGFAVDGSRVYISATPEKEETGGRLHAVDKSTGHVLWQFDAAGRIWSGPAFRGNTVFVASNVGSDGHLYAVNASSGTRQWEYNEGEEFSSEPSIGGQVVAVGGGFGDIVGVDVASGKKVLSSEADEAVTWPPSFSADTMYYVGATLYAVG